MDVQIKDPWDVDDSVRADLAIVVDVFRATSTACTLMHRGASPTYLVPKVEDLPTVRSQIVDTEFLIFSEIEAASAHGRRLQNYPAKAKQVDLTGVSPVISSNEPLVTGSA